MVAIHPNRQRTFRSARAPRRTTSRKQSIPMDAVVAHRTRTRRGGPHTALPFLPIIGICVGVAIAYVSQTAHMTQSTYRVSSLSAQQTQLRQDDQHLADELARLHTGARIDAAAQQFGMKPANKWVYVPGMVAPLQPIANTVSAGLAKTSDPVQAFIAALSGSFGSVQAEAAGP